MLLVDWDAITGGRSTATNYQLLPGDRLFVRDLEAERKSSPPRESVDRQDELPRNQNSQTTAPLPAEDELLTVVGEDGASLPNPAQAPPAKLVAQSDLVLLQVIIAETDANKPVDEGELDGCPDALVAWTKKHGNFQVLSRPQIMTVNERAAFVQTGTLRDTVTLEATPQINPDGKGIVVKLSVGKSKTTNRKDGHWTKEEISSGTNVTAEDGRTVIVTGLRTSREDQGPEVIVALTPRIVKSGR